VTATDVLSLLREYGYATGAEKLVHGGEGHVTAYYLIAEDGSDPIVADVLGIKREQVEGIRNPDMPLIERLDRGGNNIRRLAESFLGKRAS